MGEKTDLFVFFYSKIDQRRDVSKKKGSYDGTGSNFESENGENVAVGNVMKIVPNDLIISLSTNGDLSNEHVAKDELAVSATVENVASEIIAETGNFSFVTS